MHPRFAICALTGFGVARCAGGRVGLALALSPESFGITGAISAFPIKTFAGLSVSGLANRWIVTLAGIPGIVCTTLSAVRTIIAGAFLCAAVFAFDTLVVDAEFLNTGTIAISKATADWFGLAGTGFAFIIGLTIRVLCTLCSRTDTGVRQTFGVGAVPITDVVFGTEVIFRTALKTDFANAQSGAKQTGATIAVGLAGIADLRAFGRGGQDTFFAGAGVSGVGWTIRRVQALLFLSRRVQKAGSVHVVLVQSSFDHAHGSKGIEHCRIIDLAIGQTDERANDHHRQTFQIIFVLLWIE